MSSLYIFEGGMSEKHGQWIISQARLGRAFDPGFSLVHEGMLGIAKGVRLLGKILMT
jgi:hypothetical protein